MTGPDPGAEVNEADPAPAVSYLDYRFTLANERTFLAWMRTVLGLAAAAVAVVYLVPDPTRAPALTRWIGLALVLTALFCAIWAPIRWRSVESAMRSGGNIDAVVAPIAVSVVVVVIMVATGALIVMG